MIKYGLGILTLLCTCPVLLLGFVWRACLISFAIGQAGATALFFDKRAR